jgi:hypothetical protein
MTEFKKGELYFRGTSIFRLSASDYDEYKWEIKQPGSNWRKFHVKAAFVTKDHQRTLGLLSPVMRELFNLEGCDD